MSDDLDLRQLRAFATLARVGSYTRTAALMHVTQSAISHGMRRLEQQVGRPLLYKQGRTARLTPEGLVFLGHISKGLEDIDRAVISASGRFAEARGRLSVILSTSIAHRILASVLLEFRESYPRISVAVRLEDTPRAVQEIEEGRCDLALVVEDDLARGLTKHFLFQDELQFAFSALHPWTEKTRITARDISRESFLLFPRTSITFRRQEDFFLRIGAQPASYVEIASVEIMKEMARLGLGVAIMAPWAFDSSDGCLESRKLPKFPIRRRWSIIRQGNRTLHEPEQTFIGLCRMACQFRASGARGG